MMNDYHKDLDVFPAETQRKNGRNYAWIMSRRVDRSKKKQEVEHNEDSTSLFDASTSWFKFEELIDDWLDLTVLEAEKRGPALKNRLVGDAEMYKGLLDRESPRATNGVKYFRDTLRLHFIEGAQSVFLCRWNQFTGARRRNVELVNA